MFWTITILLYVLLAFGIVAKLLINGMRPSKSLAWLLAIFTIPIGGILLYLMVGRNRRKNKLFTLKDDFTKNLPEPPRSKPTENVKQHRNLVNLIYGSCGYPLTCNNSVEILRDGKATFDCIFNALETAKDHIHIQYYIFEDGELAERFFKILEAKRKEGVSIRVMYDSVGSFSLDESYKKRLNAIGVEVGQFLPFRLGKFISSLNYRNHRKIVIIDNIIGFTGGINVSDKYLKEDTEIGSWQDTHMKIEGDAVNLLNRIFLTDWYLATEKEVKIPSNTLEKEIQHKIPLQIVPSGPDDDFAVMEQVYFKIINNAKDYLYIVNPYIIPNHAILQSLQTAALSGVDVRLLISATTDYKMVDWCVRSYFESYLKSGIKVHLHPDAFIHSKIMVSDDKIASIGTANLDNRSLQQNYETNAIIYHEALSIQVKEQFLKDCESAIRLSDFDAYHKRSKRKKLLEGAAKLLSPML
ncbi:cardiolipin synthase [Croceivirga radicis]|uniref:cardiolipin synthase n=1 Tax=Croceivirga radicis TaxID=1929488 RepID=UPI000255B0B1|nr:cardiolipin synthase [Croceivirga radicis]